jgi:hypothetical protein
MVHNIVYCYLAALTSSTKPLDEVERIHLRFLDSIKIVKGTRIKLTIIVINGQEDAVSKAFKRKLPANSECIPYYGGGFDVGAYKYAASNLNQRLPHVFFNTQAYLKNSLCIDRLIASATYHGPGVFGPMASFERNAHIRTCCFATFPQTLLQYPVIPKSYSDACEFEHGTNNFSLWCISQGLPAYLVSFDKELPLNQWRSLPNGFRNGDQSGCMAFDKHTLIFENSPAVERLILRMLADGYKDH